ncbi:C1q-like venom protein [Halictus rubicundus]|uniref:C1q-like venom protein n=1 Tax=Halictus rubicundus TaxID=77578 RepID=UPI004036BF0A
MVVWTLLLLMAAILAEAAVPDPPSPGITTVGSLKLATAADCAGVVAFSATQGSIDLARVVFSETLVDKGVGYVAQTGIFTTHCPGLYQFSFAGYGSTDLQLTLKKKLNNSDSWRPVVSTGPGGGANLILLEVEAGDHLAVFADSGKITNGVTFSGYRIAKKQ